MFDELVNLYNATARMQAMAYYGGQLRAAESLTDSMNEAEKLVRHYAGDAIPWAMTYTRIYVPGYGWASANFIKRI